jgi:hypothetical protein
LKNIPGKTKVPTVFQMKAGRGSMVLNFFLTFLELHLHVKNPGKDIGSSTWNLTSMTKHIQNNK